MSHFVNFGLLFSFLTLAVSGVLSFVSPFSISVARLHIIFGLVTLILIGLHLFTKIKYFKKQTKLRGKEITVCLFAWIVIMFAAYENWAPVKVVIDQSHESKHRREIVRPHPLAATLQDGERITTTREAEKADGTAVSLHLIINKKLAAGTTLAIWAESKNGTIIETLYLSPEVAYDDNPEWFGKKTPRHHILPVWRHRYTVISGVGPDGKIDAASGATQDHKFTLDTHLSSTGEPFTIFLEINAHGDADETWKDPHLGQPSVLYSVYIEPDNAAKYTLLELTGQGAEATVDGAVNYDIEAIGSAKKLLEIALVELEIESQ